MFNPEDDPRGHRSRTAAQDGRNEWALYRKLHRLTERIFCVPPDARNFDWYLAPPGHDPNTLGIARPEGTHQHAILEFRQFLPEGWSMKFEERAGKREARTVYINARSMLYRGGGLSVLQQIGWVREESGIHFNWVEKTTEPVYQLYRALNATLYRKAIFSEILTESFGSAHFRTKVFSDMAHRVRNSWGWALGQAREIEKAGFSVLSEFGSLAAVEEYIAYHLTQTELLMRMGEVVFGDTPIRLAKPFVQPAATERLFGYRRPDIYPRTEQEA